MNEFGHFSGLNSLTARRCSGRFQIRMSQGQNSTKSYCVRHAGLDLFNGCRPQSAANHLPDQAQPVGQLPCSRTAKSGRLDGFCVSPKLVKFYLKMLSMGRSKPLTWEDWVGPPFEMRPQPPCVPLRILLPPRAFMRGGDVSKS